MVRIITVRSKSTDIVKNKKLEPDFEPSMKILSRIITRMLANGNKGKTELSANTNLNYSRLANHIVWMEKRGLVELKIDGTKIKIGLTKKGREFASIISTEK
jgi:predicted transcriptional regulator